MKNTSIRLWQVLCNFAICILLLTGCSIETPVPTMPILPPTASPEIPTAAPASPTAQPSSTSSPTATPQPTPTQTSTPTPASYPRPVHPGWTSITNGNLIRTMMFDREGGLWTGGTGGLVYWDVKKGTYVKYTAEHGLPGNFVNAIAQAADGSIWIGTCGNGLARFDGVNWKSIPNPGGFPVKEILSIASAPDGSMWFGNAAGVLKYDQQNWTPFGSSFGPKPLANVDVLAFAPDGDLWIGGHEGGGLLRFDGVQVQVFTDQLGVDTVTSLSFSPQGDLWVGTRTGVVRYDGHTWQHFELWDHPAAAVSAIAFGPQGDVWVSFSFYQDTGCLLEFDLANKADLSQALWRYDGGSWQAVTSQEGWQGGEVTTIVSDPHGSLWFGTFNQGVFHYDGKQWIPYRTQDTLAFNIVMDVDVSPDGTIWVGHGYDGGASRLDGQEWTYLGSDLDQLGLGRNVRGIMAGPGGSGWVGTYNGAAYFDGKQWTPFLNEQYPFLGTVGEFLQRQDGTVLLGSDKGLAQYDGLSLTNISRLTNFDINSLVERPGGILWIAMDSVGVYCYDGNRLVRYTQEDGLVSDSINSIAAAPDRVLWFGALEGISLFDGEHWTQPPGSEQIAGYHVGKIAIAPDGVVWVDTGQGLAMFRDGKWTFYTVQDGLANTFPHDLALGPQGEIWVATSSGLSRFQPVYP